MSLLSSRGSCIYPPPAVRNLPAEWNSKSLQFSCLENPIDRGASSMGSQSLNMTERLTCSLSLCNHKAHLQIYPTACFCHLTPLFVMGKRRQLGCLLQSHFQRLLKVKVKVAQSCLTLQQSMEFSRSEYWSGQPFPSPGDLPNSGIKPRSPTLQADSLPAKPQGKPKNTGVSSLSLLQRIIPTQELNQGLLHCRQIIYPLSYEGSPLRDLYMEANNKHSINSVQSLSHVRFFLTPWSAACQASLSITNSQSLLKLMSIKLMMPSNRTVWYGFIWLIHSFSRRHWHTMSVCPFFKSFREFPDGPVVRTQHLHCWGQGPILGLQATECGQKLN